LSFHSVEGYPPPSPRRCAPLPADPQGAAAANRTAHEAAEARLQEAEVRLGRAGRLMAALAEERPRSALHHPSPLCPPWRTNG